MCLINTLCSKPMFWFLTKVVQITFECFYLKRDRFSFVYEPVGLSSGQIICVYVDINIPRLPAWPLVYRLPRGPSRPCWERKWPLQSPVFDSPFLWIRNFWSSALFTSVCYVLSWEFLWSKFNLACPALRSFANTFSLYLIFLAWKLTQILKASEVIYIFCQIIVFSHFTVFNIMNSCQGCTKVRHVIWIKVGF